jgi:predicted RNase H-like nuclease (RuvC/YqgF family)
LGVEVRPPRGRAGRPISGGKEVEIVEIVVNAGRTFNHPHESYSNLRPSVTLKATISEGEDYEKAVKELQAKAESLIEDHKQNMLRSLEELYELDMTQQEVARLETHLRDAQSRLDEIRKEYPQLKLQIEEKPEEEKPESGGLDVEM